MRILVRATNWIGDAVMSLPAIRAIHERYPQAGITVLAKPWVAALYEGERAIERIILLDAGITSVARRLRKESRGARFDLAVLLPNSLKSALGVWLAGAKEDRRLCPRWPQCAAFRCDCNSGEGRDSTARELLLSGIAAACRTAGNASGAERNPA